MFQATIKQHLLRGKYIQVDQWTFGWIKTNKKIKRQTTFLNVDDKGSDFTSLVLVRGKIKVSGNKYFIPWSRYSVRIKVAS